MATFAAERGAQTYHVFRAPRWLIPQYILGIHMSTSRTGRLQQARLARLGLHTRVLCEQRDVDDFDDAIHVAAQAPWSRFARTLTRIHPQIGAAEAVA